MSIFSFQIMEYSRKINSCNFTTLGTTLSNERSARRDRHRGTHTVHPLNSLLLTVPLVALAILTIVAIVAILAIVKLATVTMATQELHKMAHKVRTILHPLTVNPQIIVIL